MIDRPSPAARMPLERVRALAMALPKVTERISHGEPSWFVGKQFILFADHHHDDRIGFWAAATAGAQEDWVSRDGNRFYVPPYYGARGWVGVHLDVDVDWNDVADIVEDAYRAVAPAKLRAVLDAETP